MKRSLVPTALAGAILAGGFTLTLQAGEGYTDTPLIEPGGKWKVHDADRPQPPVVTPGTFSTNDAPGKPPSDAVVLFDGKDLSNWQGGAWKVENGYMEVTKGQLETKEEFGDVQLHLEFCTPPPKGKGQGRGNSGIFFFGRYEIQVLDCYQNPTYADGSTGALYGQYPPLVLACRPPGEWQMYDIVFKAPRFKGNELDAPATATVFLNGVLLHDCKPLLGPTQHRRATKYGPHGPKGRIALQDHGNPMRFRNIWVRPLKGYDEP